GERSIQACRERCDERWRAPDSCAAPDSDITFADFDASTKSCKPEHAAALAGTWTIQTSPANGDPGSRYRVKLDVDGCKLFVGRGKELSSSRRSITGGGRVVGGHSWALDVKAGHESMKWTFAGRAPGFGQFSVKARAVAGTATAHRDP
ncbi:MAG: hypothetical protein KC636_17565, partial [Myxococcales bacterium]|nr:hypothetical protein [Myxococcales bacterium]